MISKSIFFIFFVLSLSFIAEIVEAKEKEKTSLADKMIKIKGKGKIEKAKKKLAKKLEDEEDDSAISEDQDIEDDNEEEEETHGSGSMRAFSAVQKKSTPPSSTVKKRKEKPIESIAYSLFDLFAQTVRGSKKK